jgi:hypothetical protein
VLRAGMVAERRQAMGAVADQLTGPGERHPADVDADVEREKAHVIRRRL